MADPSYAAPEGVIPVERTPSELKVGRTLGQTFTAVKPFVAVGGEFPTWGERGSGVTLSLCANGPGGKPLGSRRVENLEDNASRFLDLDTALPAGIY